MKSIIYLSILCCTCWFWACISNNTTNLSATKVKKKSYTIAIGSCSKQTKNQKILDTVLLYQPDLFIYLGDNIYGDTRDMSVLKKKYQKLADKPEFQRLRQNTKILATWDDHDYGENDAGKEYPFKKESKEIFLDFWNESKDSERRQHPGIYHSEIIDIESFQLQIILLDTRSFRDGLIPRNDSSAFKNDYRPNPSPDSSFLGAAQWKWLETKLKLKADLRIIASSNQFAHEYNGWESWTNVPHERQKMLRLIETTKAEGVVFISGDVHWGELSKLAATANRYPIYDLTSSGLTQNWDSTEPNRNRLGSVVRKNNFGIIEITTAAKTLLDFKLINKHNEIALHHRVPLNDLKFKN